MFINRKMKSSLTTVAILLIAVIECMKCTITLRACTFSDGDSGVRCTDGQCIYQRWLCDGDDDCDSDESNCPLQGEPVIVDDDFEHSGSGPITTTDTNSVRTRQNCTTPGGDPGFRCPNGACRPYSYICDGDNDCGDNYDETDCGLTTETVTNGSPSTRAPDLYFDNTQPESSTTTESTITEVYEDEITADHARADEDVTSQSEASRLQFFNFALLIIFGLRQCFLLKM